MPEKLSRMREISEPYRLSTLSSSLIDASTDLGAVPIGEFLDLTAASTVSNWKRSVSQFWMKN
jgi:hypothetical protein